MKFLFYSYIVFFHYQYFVPILGKEVSNFWTISINENHLNKNWIEKNQDFDFASIMFYLLVIIFKRNMKKTLETDRKIITYY